MSDDDEAVEDEPAGEPADEPDDDDDEGGSEVEEAEPARYTMAEIAEQLGPRFSERYLEPHGDKALAEYGKSFENTLGLVGRGAHREPQDDEVYRSLGLEPPEPEAEEEPIVAPLYGAPWAEPESWDELVELAGTNPRRAAEFALARDDLPNETKAWFFANWASVDAAGAFEYNQSATTAAAQRYADEQAAAIRAEVGPLVQDHMTRNATMLVDRAREQIPGFNDHSPAVAQLMDERQKQNPAYHEWFLNADLGTQLQEMRDLTGIAIFRAQPAAEAQAAQEEADLEASKTRAKTETTRASGTGRASTQQSDFKRQNVEAFRKLKEQGVI